MSNQALAPPNPRLHPLNHLPNPPNRGTCAVPHGHIRMTRRRYDLRLCVACGIERGPERYALGDKTCDICHRRALCLDTRAKRATLIHARREAHVLFLQSLPSPYRVRCATCGRDQAPTHFPWILGRAVRDAVCKSCCGSRAGRPRTRPVKVPTVPFGPTARRTAARRLARKLLRA